MGGRVGLWGGVEFIHCEFGGIKPSFLICKVYIINIIVVFTSQKITSKIYNELVINKLLVCE